jgi:hypothetical protein
MRYIPKHKKLVVGQRRIVGQFLFFPKKINDEVRWLERVVYEQKVVAVDVGGSMQWGKRKNKWRDNEWLD